LGVTGAKGMGGKTLVGVTSGSKVRVRRKDSKERKEVKKNRTDLPSGITWWKKIGGCGEKNNSTHQKCGNGRRTKWRRKGGPKQGANSKPKNKC